MDRPIHDQEIKVRLSEADYDVLQAMARREGLPLAAFTRALLKRQMRRLAQPTPRVLEN